MVKNIISQRGLGAILQSIFQVYALFGLGNESDETYSLFDLHWNNVQNPYIADFRPPSNVSSDTKIPKKFI